MGTGSVESLVLKWLGRLPTVPVPFFGRATGKHREKWGQAPRGSRFCEDLTCFGLGASPPFFTPVYSLSTYPRTVRRSCDLRP